MTKQQPAKPSKPPRFIAGAVCPNCGDIDSIQHWFDSDEIRCVSCDFRQSANERDSQNNQQTNSVGEIQIKRID